MYNPDYIPSGPNNRVNPYYRTINNSRISRSQDGPRLFGGGAA
jgi:hypothetical protein